MRCIATAAPTILVCLAAGLLRAETAPAGSAQNIPENKRTKLGLYVTAAEAFARWKDDRQRVLIVDCRTPEEYLFVGHPAMAPNIPLAFWDRGVYEPDGQPTMLPNPAFVEEVKRRIGPDTTILVMCRSGERSAKAADALAEAGLKRVYSIVDGGEGDVVDNPMSAQHGKRMKNGWRNSRLPWTYELKPELIYRSPPRPE